MDLCVKGNKPRCLSMCIIIGTFGVLIIQEVFQYKQHSGIKVLVDHYSKHKKKLYAGDFNMLVV